MRWRCSFGPFPPRSPFQEFEGQTPPAPSRPEHTASPEQTFSCIDRDHLTTDAAYRLLAGCVAPRPVAWITSIDGTGRVNAAPFSACNYVADSPPMVAVNIAKRPGSNANKDTARNILLTREFVVNVATEDNMEVMHLSARSLLRN